MIPPVESLVKYDKPVLVSSAKDKGKAKKTKAEALGVDKKGKALQTEDILNAILPPREWTEDGELWVQYVSAVPATRSDAISLGESLDQRLQLRRARDSGICTIREELYAQAFDELIRQITIECAERGLLLLRIRDEARMRIAAYQTLYESSLAFAVRKAILGEDGKTEIEGKIKEMTADKKDKNKQLQELQERFDTLDSREEERWETMKKKQFQEIRSLKDAYKNQTKQLQELLAPPPGFVPRR
uniref:Dynein light intermediate chain n=1 Tax=Hemiselmis andersenii TaxID=464988 RepID=A0A6U4N7B2_HEMAN|mmetsp:Transcript_20301/g.46860  ORF Transcript_20301/g.46860 Transcript_20301/m.46860 type:complete len:245 (+) Transcript_20301:212-946(+)